jgi:hypothetical protein
MLQRHAQPRIDRRRPPAPAARTADTTHPRTPSASGFLQAPDNRAPGNAGRSGHQGRAAVTESLRFRRGPEPARPLVQRILEHPILLADHLKRRHASSIAQRTFCVSYFLAVSKGKSVCRRYWLRRDPFENFILERVEKRLQKFLKRGGEQTLRRFIAEEILAKTPDPAEELAKLKGELATLAAEADRLLDIATPANRDFVDERLGKIRARRRDAEARLADMERVDYQPVDVEAATADALAYLAKFREVLQEGTLEQRKEFLRGFVAEIGIDPDTARGTITFYELPVMSLMGMPGARDELLGTLRSKQLDGFGLPDESWRMAA